MGSKSKQLRSGYTTGACAAAAAKAAAIVLARGSAGIDSVEIPFPDGSRVGFRVQDTGYREQGMDRIASASVIKDAGDDPDVTNGAEIAARARLVDEPGIMIKGGIGVGRVTKPGLAVPTGGPAINPVPRSMIEQAVREAIAGTSISGVEITISVPAGEELAKKTLNRRLGIVGGISILGTTGVVKPLSDAAWTATILSSLDVAKAQGREEAVLSTGRTSEKAHQRKFALPDDCYAMMGDHAEFSLRAAAERGFRKVHLAAQWAKMIKIAMGTPQTHVQHGALEAEQAKEYLIGLGIALPDMPFNTSREIYDMLRTAIPDPQSAIEAVCTAACRYAEKITAGIPVTCHLVSYEGEIIASSE